MTRWQSILRDGLLRASKVGDKHVSLTTDPSVAKYFADLASRDDDSEPIILAVDVGGLPIEPFSSSVWGAGKCDWEKEIACLEDVPTDRINPLS